VLSDYLYSGITLQPGTYKIGLKGGDIASGRNVYVDVVSFPSVGPPPDTDPPEATITSGPSSGEAINDNTPTFEFTSNEPNSTFECFIGRDGGPGPYWGGAFPCTSPYTTEALEDGVWAFTVRAIDAGGNKHSWDIGYDHPWRSFTVDTTAPVVDAMGGIDGVGGQPGSRQADFTANEPTTFECSFTPANAPAEWESCTSGVR
jgi:hypothetical protein